MSENQRNINKIGWYYTALIVLLIGISILGALFNKYISYSGMLIVNKIAFVIPITIYAVKNKDQGKVHEIKPVNIITSIAIAFLSAPAAILFNLISQILTVNKVSETADTLIADNILIIILTVCILSPILEEIFFREILYRRLKEYSPTIKALITSALCFGLYHMNFNQFCYAFLMGIIFALMREASGSVISPIIAHITLNTANLCLLLKKSDIATVSSGMDGDLSIMIAITLIIALVCAPMLYANFIYMAKTENRLADFKDMLRDKAADERVLFNIPIMTGILICIAIMMFL